MSKFEEGCIIATIMIGVLFLLFVTNINTAFEQREIEIGKIKNEIIKNPDITCLEYLQSIEREEK